MHYLILCILSSTGIFIVFKFLDRKNIAPYPVIVINYLVASIFGFLINSADYSFIAIANQPWLPISFLIGVLFILMFFVIARSSQVAGITSTTVASKMSVVFPIVFSMIIDPTDALTLTKLLAIITALIGVLLTVYSPGSNSGLIKKITLPLVLFIGMGIVDSLVKFAQHRFVENPDRALFSAVLFFIAFLTGLLMLPFRKKSIVHFKKVNTWLWGIGLGIFNFGSIYLMVSALNFVNAEGVGTDSSVIFGLNNIGIVSLSLLAGVLIFIEKLKAINWIGIALSVIAIILFTIHRMRDSYFTIDAESKGLFKDRGSKFFAFAFPVTSEQEIKNHLEKLRKEYHDARHHCYAWRLKADHSISRANDDGEPSSSAGKPILNQIESRGLTNVLLVVIRYFGGTLLGVGGLINAYRTAAADSLDNSKIIEKYIYKTFKIRFDYSLMNAVMKIIKEHDLKNFDHQFELSCSLIIDIRIDRVQTVLYQFELINGCDHEEVVTS